MKLLKLAALALWIGYTMRHARRTRTVPRADGAGAMPESPAGARAVARGARAGVVLTLVLLALATLVLGVVLGTAFLHAAWNTAAKSVGDRWVSSLLIGAVNFAAGLVGVIAAVLPAVRAARLNVLGAIAHE